MTDFTTLLLNIGLAVVVLGFIFGLFILMKKHKEYKPVITTVASAIPTALDVLQSIVTKGDKKAPVNHTFEVLKEIAKTSATSVEQIASKEDMSSEDKMKLATENFHAIANSSGLKTSGLDEKAVQALIENVVYHLDSKTK